MKINPFLSPYTKLKSKWMNDFHIKPGTLKVKEEKTCVIEHIFTGENYLNRTPIAYALRSSIDKWNLLKLKSFLKAKDSVNRTKQQPADWENNLVILHLKEANTNIQRTQEVRLQRIK